MFLFCLLPRRFLGKLSTEDEFLTARKVFPAKKNILTQKNIRPHQRSCCFRIWQTFCQDCRQGASMDWPMTSVTSKAPSKQSCFAKANNVCRVCHIHLNLLRTKGTFDSLNSGRSDFSRSVMKGFCCATSQNATWIITACIQLPILDSFCPETYNHCAWTLIHTIIIWLDIL